MNQQEIWRDIPDYEGYYQISSLGNVKSLDRTVSHPRYPQGVRLKGKPMVSCTNSRDYLQVLLSIDSKRTTYSIHRLVGVSFIPNPLKYTEINHKDGDKKNNLACNLEWCTRSQNLQHAYDTGLKHGRKGEKHHSNKLTMHQVIEIKKALKVGIMGSVLADEYCVARSCISRIKTGIRWGHIKIG